MTTDQKPRSWTASRQEHRTAWMVAAACMGLIAVILIWPGLFSSDEAAKDRQAAAPPNKTYRLPQKASPAPEPAPVTKPHAPAARAGKSAPAEKPVLKKAPPASSPTTAVRAWTGGYYVQLGAFRDRAKAKALVARVRKAGWAAHIEPRSANLHAVWTGPMTSREKAVQRLQQIDKAMHIKGFIIHKKGK